LAAQHCWHKARHHLLLEIMVELVIQLAEMHPSVEVSLSLWDWGRPMVVKNSMIYVRNLWKSKLCFPYEENGYLSMGRFPFFCPFLTPIPMGKWTYMV
jgi:hypothetical protein